MAEDSDKNGGSVDVEKAGSKPVSPIPVPKIVNGGSASGSPNKSGTGMQKKILSTISNY
jgi:hypothetical protein